jgi:hypothetical protein
MVDSDCGTRGVAVFVKQLLHGFCLILFDGTVRTMDKCFLEVISEYR